MFGLSPLLLGGLVLAAVLAVGGMTTFAYKHGHDSGVEDGKRSRDKEVKTLTTERDTYEANYQTEKRDRETAYALIQANNRANDQLTLASENARKAAQAAAQASAGRSKADQSLLATLLGTAKTGTESATACPKTAGLLGDASNVAHTFDRTVGTAAVGPPAPAPVVTTAPLPPKPPAPPAQPVAPPAKALPPAIRVKP